MKLIFVYPKVLNNLCSDYHATDRSKKWITAKRIGTEVVKYLGLKSTLGKGQDHKKRYAHSEEINLRKQTG